MKPINYLLASLLITLSTCLFAVDGDLPLVEGKIAATDDARMTVAVEGLSYQLKKTTRIFLKGSGNITFQRIKPGMPARLIITDPPILTPDGIPVLSSIILSEIPDNK